jgi:hypothetical protein
MAKTYTSLIHRLCATAILVIWQHASRWPMQSSMSSTTLCVCVTNARLASIPHCSLFPRLVSGARASRRSSASACSSSPSPSAIKWTIFVHRMRQLYRNSSSSLPRVVPPTHESCSRRRSRSRRSRRSAAAVAASAASPCAVAVAIAIRLWTTHRSFVSCVTSRRRANTRSSSTARMCFVPPCRARTRREGDRRSDLFRDCLSACIDGESSSNGGGAWYDDGDDDDDDESGGASQRSACAPPIPCVLGQWAMRAVLPAARFDAFLEASLRWRRATAARSSSVRRPSAAL